MRNVTAIGSGDTSMISRMVDLSFCSCELFFVRFSSLLVQDCEGELHALA